MHKCPDCQRELEFDCDGLICRHCGIRFVYEDGILDYATPPQNQTDTGPVQPKSTPPQHTPQRPKRRQPRDRRTMQLFPPTSSDDRS